MRLSPIDPEKDIAMSGIGMSYLMLERHEEALAWGEKALREMPNYGSSYRVVIGALVGLGRTEEARAAVRRLIEAFPTYTLTLQKHINPWRDAAFGERYIEALRVAGVPE
jgi:adenylate cyclase